MGRIEELYQRLEREQRAGLRANRWGECRRFAGRMAGNRLDRIDHIRQMIDREYAKRANPDNN